MTNNNYYTFVRKDILPFIDDPIKCALDVGCATGQFGKYLKENIAKEVWGIEPVEFAYHEAKQNLDKVIHGIFDENISLPLNHFNAIFFNDVLEHMEDPWTSLKIASRFLTNDGVLYASIPNFLFFNNIYSLVKTRDWKYADAGILDRTHLRFFTKKSVVRLFHDVGYDIIDINGINPTENNKFKFLHRLMPNRLEEFKYTQYFVKARPAINS